MNLLQLIRSMVCSDKTPRPFDVLYSRSGDHIRDVLRAAFPHAQIKIADRKYSAPSIEDFNRWIKKDCVSERQYFAEYHDCDNFARALRCAMFKINLFYKTEITMPYCEGDSAEGYHAFNAIVTNDDSVFIAEPQSDEVVPYRESDCVPDFVQL